MTTGFNAFLQALRQRFCASPTEAIAVLGHPYVTQDPRHRWMWIGLRPTDEISLKQSQLKAYGQFQSVEDPVRLEKLLRVLWSPKQTLARDHWQSSDPLGLLDHWPDDAPLAGGWVGFVGYEFARWLEPALGPAVSAQEDAEFPELQFWQFEDWLLCDVNAPETLWVATPNAARRTAYRQLWQACRPWLPLAEENHLAPTTTPMAVSSQAMPELAEGCQASFTPEAFERAVEQIQQHIRVGNLYQANLSLRFRQPVASLCPIQTYAYLCQHNPSPFSALLCWQGSAIVCNSPERLVAMDAKGRLSTRPIAGTRGRGQTPDEDERLGLSLLNNSKERAEHLMLVDLARNDLGRLCLPGSVRVDELLTLERYSHVTHLVSNVVGQARAGVDAWDVLQALFPGGTITGCPKIRCMETLLSLEPVPRGPYTGAIGYICPQTGALDFNIVIRSLFLSPVPWRQDACPDFGYNATIHAGAGIVADSVAVQEYRECLRKAAVLLGALNLHDGVSSVYRSDSQFCQPIGGERY
ncbi:MAG: anthranilate synthase component I family protein [Candidatus Melainabacteria bacterium]|nr:anthranilate synthase component I family protein [Candidatus Melainabacteria bacterium]